MTRTFDIAEMIGVAVVGVIIGLCIGRMISGVEYPASIGFSVTIDSKDSSK